MSDDVSGSDSDDLIWDFGKPNIPEDIEEKFVKMKESKRKNRKSKLWPSPHSMKVAVDNAQLNKPESPPQVKNEPLEAFRSHIRLFRDRLDKIAQEHTSIVTEDIIPTKKLTSSDKNSPPHKKVKAECDASILNDSIDEDSLTLCSQLVEDRFINDHVHFNNLLADRRGTSSSSNKVVMSTAIENSPDNALRGFQPRVRDRLDEIAQKHTNIVTEDISPTKKLISSDKNSPPQEKGNAKCDASILNDSIDEDSLTLCSQLVEDRFINDHIHFNNLLANQRGTSSSSNKVVMSTAIENSPDNALRGSQPKVNQSSIASNLLDDDDDLFLNESLLSY